MSDEETHPLSNLNDKCPLIDLFLGPEYKEGHQIGNQHLLPPEKVHKKTVVVAGAYSTISQTSNSEKTGENHSEDAIVFVPQKGIMMNNADPVVLLHDDSLSDV